MFYDGTLSGNTISWGSVGPGGLYCFCLARGDAIICAVNGALLADTKPTLRPWGPPINAVDHLSFSPKGGWFTSYSNGSVRLSAEGAFPESFHLLAARFLQTRNNQGLQTSSIRNVFFGHDQAILVKLANGVVFWSNLPEPLDARLREMCSQGWTVGRNTSLCQWSSGYYFVEFVRWYQFRYVYDYCYCVPDSGILSSVLVREVVEGGVPVSHTVPRERFSTRISGRSTPAPYPALPAGNATEQQNDPAQPKLDSRQLASKNPFRRLPSTTTSASKAPVLATKNPLVETRPTGSAAKVTDDEYQTYKYLFLATDKDGKGYVNGEQMLQLFESSGLGRDELANIWVRADTDMNGRLDLDEFCNAMHLIGQKRKARAA